VLVRGVCRMRTHAFTRWLATICFFSCAAVAVGQAGPRPQLQTLDQLTRLHIPITSGSSFRMLSGKNGEVTLIIDRVVAAELASLAQLSYSRVEKVSVRALGLDRSEVEVRFRDSS